MLFVVIFILSSLSTFASLGGKKVESNSFMRVGSINGCKATLIRDTIAITAAHCVINEASEFLFHFSLFDGSGGADWIPVERIFVHPKYNSKKVKTYDLALVVLKRYPSRSDFWGEERVSVELNDNFPITNQIQNSLFVISQASNGLGGMAPWTKTSVRLKNNLKKKPANSYLPVKGSKICPGDSGAPIFAKNKSGELSLHAIISGGRADLAYSLGMEYRTLRNQFGKAPGCNDVRKKFYAIPLARHEKWINNTIKNTRIKFQ